MSAVRLVLVVVLAFVALVVGSLIGTAVTALVGVAGSALIAGGLIVALVTALGYRVVSW